MTTELVPHSRPASDDGELALFNPEAMAFLEKHAEMYSRSDIIPDTYKGKPENCFIAINLARRLKLDPLTVMQNVFPVYGRLGMTTAFQNALVLRAGAFRGPITHSVKAEGQNLIVTAHATIASTGEKVSATVDMRMAQAEGWLRNPKYKSMPEHMLKYRATSFLIRQYCPAAYLGVPTHDELVDTRDDNMKVVNHVAHAEDALIEATEAKVAANPKPEDDLRAALDAARVTPPAPTRSAAKTKNDVTSHHNETEAEPPARRKASPSQLATRRQPEESKPEPNPMANTAIDRGGEIDF
jgi:hypothetical protein